MILITGRDEGVLSEFGWGRHCGAPAAAGTGVLRALVAADRTGEPVRGPRAVEAGKAEIPERAKPDETIRAVTVPP